MFFLVFALVPSILISLGWQFVSQQRMAGDRDAAISEIHRDLLRLRRDGDDRLYVQRQLNFLYGSLAEEDFDEKVIESYLARFRDDGFGFVNFRFFNADRSNVNLKNQPETRRAIVQKIFEALLQPENAGESSLLMRYRPFFDAFIGGITPSEISQEKSSLLRVMMSGRPACFYWNTFYTPEPENRFKGGFVAYFSESEMPQNMALEHLLASINDEARGQRLYGLLNLAAPEQSLPAAPELKLYKTSQEELVQRASLLRNNFESQDELSDFLMITEFFSPDKVLFCLDRSQKGFYDNVSTLLKVLILVWLMIVAKVASSFEPRADLETDECESSFCCNLTPRRYIVIFAATVPVLAMLILGVQYREAFGRMLMRETFAQLAARIESVDENYQVAVRNLESVYRKVTRLGIVRDMNVAELEKLAVDLSRKDAINRLHIVDRDGRLRFSWPAERSSNDISGKIIPAITRRIFITQRGDEESLQDRVSDMMIDSFTDSFADVLGDTGASLLRTFENLDRINELWLANRRHYVYTNFVERAAGKDPWLLYIWHGTVSFAQRYLQRQIQRNIDDQFGSRSQIRLAMVPRERSRLPFPRDFNKYPFVAQLSGQILSSETQQFSVDSMGGEKWLVAAAPLKRVPDYLLFAMYPQKLLDQKTCWLTTLIGLAAVLSMVAALALARVIEDL